MANELSQSFEVVDSQYNTNTIESFNLARGVIANKNTAHRLLFERCKLNSNRKCISESSLKYRAQCCLNPLLLLLESYKSAYYLNGAP